LKKKRFFAEEEKEGEETVSCCCEAVWVWNKNLAGKKRCCGGERKKDFFWVWTRFFDVNARIYPICNEM